MRPLPLLAIFWVTAAIAPAVQAQLTPKSVVFQGLTRTWFEHVPASYNGSHPVPLVLALHGFNDSGDQFAATSEWIPKADAAGFIVVFPTGGNPVYKVFGWHAWAMPGEAPDDGSFLLALIGQLKKDYHIDPARVYMTGFSNGGGMTSTFAELHAGVLAGIAPVSGGWVDRFGPPGAPVQPDAPVPVWIWRGTEEKGEKTSQEIAQMDYRQIQFWVTANGDQNPSRAYRQRPYTTNIYRGGKAEVRYTTIEGADHGYQPGTAEKIWDGFFALFSRQGNNIVYHPPK